MSVEENKDRIRFFVEQVVNAHDLEREREVVVPAILDEALQHLRQLFDGFPDIRGTIDDMFGEGDKVVARVTLSGTHTGTFAGAAPTGKRITWTSIRIWRFEEGKVAETWAMQDRLGLLTQLGLVDLPAEPIHWAGSISASGG
jgi:predicted ester cyclase